MADHLPPGAFRTGISATYNLNTIPRELRRPSVFPPETWGLVVVEFGSITLFVGSLPGQNVEPGVEGFIPPQTPFHVEDKGLPVLFHIEYFHEPRLADPQALAAQLGGRG